MEDPFELELEFEPDALMIETGASSAEMAIVSIIVVVNAVPSSAMSSHAARAPEMVHSAKAMRLAEGKSTVSSSSLESSTIVTLFSVISQKFRACAPPTDVLVNSSESVPITSVPWRTYVVPAAPVPSMEPLKLTLVNPTTASEDSAASAAGTTSVRVSGTPYHSRSASICVPLVNAAKASTVLSNIAVLG